ncbi:MAG: hypothetical protein Kow006_11970 [Gammaproteobacteria bacterium]
MSDFELQRLQMEVIRLTRERDELRRANQRLEKSLEVALKNASRDELSGFLNRRAGQQVFHAELGRGLREGTPTALLFIDLDGFKQVNDTLGHDQGDKLIARIARQIGAVLRDYDHPIRWGGDEFCIVLPNSGREQASLIARKVIGEVHRAASDICALVTASGGVAATDEPQIDALLDDLDLAGGGIEGVNGESYSRADVVETAVSRMQRFLFKVADLRCYCAKRRMGSNTRVGYEACAECTKRSCGQEAERERIKGYFWREDGSKWVIRQPARAVEQ